MLANTQSEPRRRRIVAASGYKLNSKRSWSPRRHNKQSTDYRRYCEIVDGCRAGKWLSEAIGRRPSPTDGAAFDWLISRMDDIDTE